MRPSKIPSLIPSKTCPPDENTFLTASQAAENLSLNQLVIFPNAPVMPLHTLPKKLADFEKAFFTFPQAAENVDWKNDFVFENAPEMSFHLLPNQDPMVLNAPVTAFFAAVNFSLNKLPTLAKVSVIPFHNPVKNPFIASIVFENHSFMAPQISIAFALMVSQFFQTKTPIAIIAAIATHTRPAGLIKN